MPTMIHRSPFGLLELVADATRLLSIRFVRRGERPRTRGRSPVLVKAARALDRYCAGKLDFPDLPLALERVSPFRRKVLETLRTQVPPGRTVSYQELALLAGSPRAARAVGSAMANNPFPFVIPCHRVLAARGLGGFGPGPELKKRLLRHEGVAVR